LIRNHWLSDLFSNEFPRILSSNLTWRLDTRMARRSIAWSFGTGTVKGSNGMTAPAASKLSLFVKCSDQFTRRKISVRGTKRTEMFTRRADYRLAACSQSVSRGSCVWRSHRLSVSMDLARERSLTWHVCSDRKRCAINRSLPSSRFTR